MNNYDNVTVRLDGVLLIHSTVRACLYRLDDGEEYWLPESVIESKNPKAGYIKVEKWFLDKQGIDYAAQKVNA